MRLPQPHLPDTKMVRAADFFLGDIDGWFCAAVFRYWPLWVGITTCAVRLLYLIINFVSPVNFTFTEMTWLMR